MKYNMNTLHIHLKNFDFLILENFAFFGKFLKNVNFFINLNIVTLVHFLLYIKNM